MRNAAIGLQKSLRGDTSEADDYFWCDGVNLAKQKGRADFHFVFFPRAIFGGPAFHHVADINVFALQAHGLNHLVQQFSCTANERQTLYVFIPPGSFANENQISFGITVAKDELGAAPVELAA